MLSIGRSFARIARRVPCRRCRYSTDTEKLIDDDGDFAGRKKTIQQLGLAEMDAKYYPTIGSIRSKLTQDLPEKPEKVRIPDFRQKYAQLFKDNPSLHQINDKYYMVSGKIKSIRRAGKGSMFVDLVQDYTRLQLLVHHKVMGLEKEEFAQIHSEFKPGDQCVCVGTPGATRVGELSLRLVKPLQLAAPALHALPPKLTDPGLINSNRVVDYLVNDRSRQIILVRSRVISEIRRFLEDRGFLEVSTPMLCGGNSGANATPFSTSSVHIDGKLSLRVAPELWLKKLIIGGFDKIYEIGQSFRNEGIDATHNPEFTTCEFYRTFTSLQELMSLTEQLIVSIAAALAQDARYPICAAQCSALVKSPFKRLQFVPELEKRTGLALPSDLTNRNLVRYYEHLGLDLPPIGSEAQLLDKLSELYLEPLCEECPTFIYDIPEVLSPLAKSAEGVSRRFELYIGGKEVVNAYEEENNPFKQALKFEMQQRLRDEYRDADALVPDHRYTEFMQWGARRIDNVLTFGRLADVLKQ